MKPLSKVRVGSEIADMHYFRPGDETWNRSRVEGWTVESVAMLPFNIHDAAIEYLKGICGVPMLYNKMLTVVSIGERRITAVAVYDGTHSYVVVLKPLNEDQPVSRA